MGRLTSIPGTSIRQLFAEVDRPREPEGRIKKNRRGPRDELDHQDLGRSRGGFGTKIHLVTDGRGIPIGAVLSPGQAADCKHADRALESVEIPSAQAGRPRTRPGCLVGDKGYSFPHVRKYLAKRGIRAVIPTRSNQKRFRSFDQKLYRSRSAVEQGVGWLKENRRIGTRYEKLSSSFLSMTHLAMMQRYFRHLEPSNRA